MPAIAHTRHFFGYSQQIITKISSLHSRLIFRRRLTGSTVCVHRNSYQRFKKMNYYTRRPLNENGLRTVAGSILGVRRHSFVEIVHGIISTAIISVALIQVGQLSITGEKMFT